jgi:hypothetical protein
MNDNRQRNQGLKSAHGNVEQEVQQSTRPSHNRRDARSQAKLHLRLGFTTLPRLILGRRSIMAETRGASSRQGEGTIPTGTTMMMITTASLPLPPTSLRNPTPRILNQSGSPSMTASKTRANGFDATPLPSRSPEDPTLPRHSISWWPRNPRPSLSSKASNQTPSTPGRISSRPLLTTSRDP